MDLWIFTCIFSSVGVWQWISTHWFLASIVLVVLFVASVSVILLCGFITSWWFSTDWSYSDSQVLWLYAFHLHYALMTLLHCNTEMIPGVGPLIAPRSQSGPIYTYIVHFFHIFLGSPGPQPQPQPQAGYLTSMFLITFFWCESWGDHVYDDVAITQQILFLF